MTIHLIQLLCPKRHGIIASIYQLPVTHDKMVELIEEAFTLGIERKCGICGAVELHYEDRELPSGLDLVQVVATLKQNEVDQFTTRAAIESVAAATGASKMDACNALEVTGPVVNVEAAIDYLKSQRN